MSDVVAVYWAACQDQIRSSFDDPKGEMADEAWRVVNEHMQEPVKYALLAVAGAAWDEGRKKAAKGWRGGEPFPGNPYYEGG